VQSHEFKPQYHKKKEKENGNPKRSQWIKGSSVLMQKYHSRWRLRCDG
jgi:hypothetical protein